MGADHFMKSSLNPASASLCRLRHDLIPAILHTYVCVQLAVIAQKLSRLYCHRATVGEKMHFVSAGVSSLMLVTSGYKPIQLE